MSESAPGPISPDPGNVEGAEPVRADLPDPELPARLRETAAVLRARPVAEMIRTLGRAGARFQDPADPLRMEAVARVPDEAGLSAEMAERVVDGMARDWDADALAALAAADFFDPSVLDRFVPAVPGDGGKDGGSVRAIGADLTVQIGAGTVPGVSATALLRSLLVKSPTLVKPGAGDRVLTSLLARAIQEEDAVLGESFAVPYWPGGQGGALEARALEEAGLVVVYGGSDTVAALRARTPVETPFVAYHHRISVGAVGRELLGSEDEAARVAGEGAEAVALFDQRGCVSPHVIWVEEGGAVTPARWAELLADALERRRAALPPGPTSGGVASAVQQLRGSVELRAAAGEKARVFSGEGVSWTVVYDAAPGFEASCLGRTVWVKPIGGLDELGSVIAPVRRFLQSVALELPEPRRGRVADVIAAAGATRITRFRDQPFPSPGWRHDGQGPLRALVRWVSLEE